MIAVVVEKSAFPLARAYLRQWSRAEFTIHVKMKRTSRIKVLVQANGKYFLFPEK